MDFGTCRSCRAPVRWAKSATSGKPMPLEPDATAGNVIVDGYGHAHVFRDHPTAMDAMDRDERFPAGETFVSHHATCPSSERWKDRRRVDGDLPVQGTLL